MLPASSTRTIIAVFYVIPLLTRVLIKLLPYLLAGYGLLMVYAWVTDQQSSEVFFSLMGWLLSLATSY